MENANRVALLNKAEIMSNGDTWEKILAIHQNWWIQQDIHQKQPSA
jgi:hypothetical protein